MYVLLFERSLKWLHNIRSLLRQSVHVGEAQKVYAALPLDQSLDYDTVKAAIHRADELVPG